MHLAGALGCRCMGKRLYLLDGMALLYRAHFAFVRQPILTTGGMDVSALFGFANTLIDILEKHSPTHMAVAMDTEEPTSRHEEFAGYKAQREAMPEVLSRCLDHLDELCDAFAIPLIRAPGHEADDIVGTLARRAEKEGFETWMVTPDKDFAQLVTGTTHILKPGWKGGDPVLMGVGEVLEEWGLERPDQVPDVLGLWGDASDNIPGVPGIGRKKGGALVRQYGSLENLLEHLNELKGRQRENLESCRNQALFSKRLATINCRVPLGIDLESLAVRGIDRERMAAFCRRFEFNRIGERLLGGEFHAGRSAARGGGAARTIGEVDHAYRCLRTRKERRELLERLGGSRAFCFDVETTGLDLRSDRLIGCAFSCRDHEAFYLPLIPYDASDRAVEGGETDGEALSDLAALLEDPAIGKVGHNLKFDVGILRALGIRVRGALHDTMLMHSLVEPELRHGMDYLAEKYLAYRPVPLSALIGEGEDAAAMLQVDLDRLAEYAAEDADVTWRLFGRLERELEASGQQEVYHRVEAPLIRVLVEMEHEGIRVDPGVLRRFSGVLEQRLASLEREVFDLAGMEFNLNSPAQLGRVLFEDLKLVGRPRKTRTGQYSTSIEVLDSLRDRHPIVSRILDYREAAKLKSTYTDTLPESIRKRTGRVHTTFHQLATATGRLNSQNPNLQNIPVRTVLGQEIRKAFIPRDEDHVLLSADYSQIELRIIASMSGDEYLMRAFREGVDVHSSAAARIFDVFPEMVTPRQRNQAKMANYGVAYGVTAHGLAQRLGISRKEASLVIEGFFRQFQGVRTYIERTLEFAREHGYVQTMMGRRRTIRDIASANAVQRAAAERNAVNATIQGTAADMIKIAMIRIQQAIEEKRWRSRMLLQVHDELLFDLHRREEEPMRAMVEREMKGALELKVPLEVNLGTGTHWLSAH